VDRAADQAVGALGGPAFAELLEQGRRMSLPDAAGDAAASDGAE
jgi:hypothetical protein